MNVVKQIAGVAFVKGRREHVAIREYGMRGIRRGPLGSFASQYPVGRGCKRRETSAHPRKTHGIRHCLSKLLEAQLPIAIEISFHDRLVDDLL